MSAAGFLEKLLGDAEVEWVPVSELFDLKNGYTPSRSNKKFWDSGTVPWFRMDDIRANGRILKDSLLKITPEAVKGGRLFAGNSIIMATSATIGEHALITVPYLANQRFTNLTVKERFETQTNIKYLFYYCFLLAEWCEKNTTKSSFASVDMNGFRRFQIPIPCPDDPEKSLAIQGEIVRILDSFTELTAELTAELTQRKKQYNHYRERLLGFEVGDVEWKSLDEIGEFIRGKRFTKADYVDEGIGAIHYGEIYTHYGVFAHKALSKVRSDLAASLRYAEPNDVVIAGVSETIEDVGKAVAWLGEEKVAIHDDSYAFRHNMNPKFIAYAMQTDAFHDQKAKYVSSGKIKRLLIDGVKNVRLPVPYPENPTKSLEEQTRIVAILDTFDTLTTSISEGLPREIELREKQYAFYRDQLLSFPKPDAEAA